MKKKYLITKTLTKYVRPVKYLAVILIVVFLWNKSDRVFYASKIECYTQYGNCSGDIISRIQWLDRTPLLKPLPRAKLHEQLKAIPYIKSVKLYRRLPNALVLSIELRKSVGMVGSQILGTNTVSDEEGIIIGTSDKQNLPFLIDKSKLKVGDKINQDQVNALKIMGQINSLSKGQLVGKVEAKTITVYFPEGFTVLMDLSHITSNWYTTLQVILDRSKILSKMPKLIDLRFSRPIVTF